MLRLQNVSLVRGVRVLYKNVNLTTSDGEIIGLVGPNGSGKSTLSNKSARARLPKTRNGVVKMTKIMVFFMPSQNDLLYMDEENKTFI